ncbi:MAG: GIY-YIG nuclease family protein [Symploca sp. SIO2E6]|nr:GIY-YIG nuclease family protein [Symploca sp. SIO2E6]
MTELPITLETIFSLPALPLEHRELLPEIPGLYFAYTLDSERQLLYIGKAQNIRQQWLRHPRLRDLQIVAHVVSQVNLAWLEFYANEEILSQQEQVLIKQFRPPINELNLTEYEWLPRDHQAGYPPEEDTSEPGSIVVSLQGSQRLIEALLAADEQSARLDNQLSLSTLSKATVVDIHPEEEEEEEPINIFPTAVYQPQIQRDLWTFLVLLLFLLFIFWESFF